MKAILQYSDADDGVYKNVGTVRTADNQDYKILPIIGQNRVGESVTIGYQIEVRARALTLNTDFLNNDSWYFRLLYSEEAEMIKLGSREYTIEFDFLSKRREIRFYTIVLLFQILKSELSDYINPESLPASEGGIYVDDDGLYIT